jgi:hypothetical protein
MILFFMSLSCEENETFVSAAADTDGDGILDSLDEMPNDPCSPAQQVDYIGYNVFNVTWANSDCDGDGVTNGVEFEDKGRNPYLDENTVDADGDGVPDFEDPAPGNPCIPEQGEGYNGFNAENEIWGSADCDGDTISNIDEFTNGTDPYLACNLNFDLSNFQRELRTVDSNNGEGITIGEIGVDCGVFVFTGGGIFNQGCFNEDVRIPFFFEPNSPESSEGTVSVPSITYSCLSEDGTETREFIVEGTGSYQGEISRIELNYTMTTPDGVETGTLNIRGLDDPGDETGNGCSLDSLNGSYNSIITIDGNEDFGSASLTRVGEGCNDFTLSGDFLNLGCGNGSEINVFLGAEEDGSEVIIQETIFSCESENGDVVEYTFNGFGNYSLTEGYFQLTEFSLSDSVGNTSSGEIFFEMSNDTGGSDCILDSFEREYNTIINTNGEESFGIAILSANEGCGNFTLSGDFLNLGCDNEFEIEIFLGAEEDGAEIIIEDAVFTCTSGGSDFEYTFNGIGSYSSSEGFIELFEYSLLDSEGDETTGSIFFEPL